MLRPAAQNRVPYSARLSATALAPHATSHDYGTMSGLSLGGVKIDSALMPEMGGLGRFALGDAVVNSQGPSVQKDASSIFMTEAEAVGQTGWAAIQRGVQNTDCRWLAAAVALVFILRKGL